jgi:hypothetical protein
MQMFTRRLPEVKKKTCVGPGATSVGPQEVPECGFPAERKVRREARLNFYHLIVRVSA